MTSDASDSMHTLFADTTGNPGLGVAALLCLGLAYFLPAFVAGARGHPNSTAIGFLNLLLGWTFVGWVVALVWSFTAIERRRRRRDEYDDW